ncbi:MAG: SufE family protein [Myxococcota bacterium]|nr:SufE family protein [Myxococcota bacterium]
MNKLTVEELYDTFEALDDWMERYKYLIDLGRELAPLNELERTEENRVKGCISQVWLVADPITEAGTLNFRADSDAHLVKGLIAVALTLFNGKNAADILATDPGDVYGRLGLDQHLSVNRRNGFVSMMQRIKGLAHHSHTA